MATIKIKFRPSSVSGKEGTLFYQVIHNRTVRQIHTNYKLFPSEWDKYSKRVVLPRYDDARKHYLLEIREKLEKDMHKMEKAVAVLDEKRQPYTADEVVSACQAPVAQYFLFPFMEEVIFQMKEQGRKRMCEIYSAALNSFKSFRNGRDILLDDIDSDVMITYETYLKNRGVSMNTSSFYMRNLRAIYNRAVEKEMIFQRYPFKHVYTGIDKTVKRAISLEEVKRIRGIELQADPSLDFARDMFMFSFYTRGMSFVDMAFLKKKDLQSGMLSYRRKKTGQQLSVKWEKEMQEIVEKYDTGNSPYLLAVIKQPGKEERRQYLNMAHLVNRKLKALGKSLGILVPLTMYVARHSWASIAKSKNIPLSVISDGMGHDSEATTQIYLASLDTTAIDKANKRILKSL